MVAASNPPFDITQVRTARQWMTLRAGPLGPLEYCLAFAQVRSLVARLGWPRLVRALHSPHIWDEPPPVSYQDSVLTTDG